MRVCLVILMLASTEARSAKSWKAYDFDTYELDFGKSYGADRDLRKVVFEDNLKGIIAHNEGYVAGNHSWFMGVNRFTDMTKAEFRQFQKKRNGPAWSFEHAMEEIPVGAKNPESVDWRSKNVVTPVKNQESCGSCWAFSATETMESMLAIATGTLLVLAPQAYVNCVQNPRECGGNGGCGGATMELAFNMSESKGLPLESELGYQAKNEPCTPYKPVAKNTGYTKISPVNSAVALETAIAMKGPISVTVAAEPWQSYAGGIFDGCSSGGSIGADLDHGVQAVGYTPEYWIVRNSWGTDWGDDGYIMLSRKADNSTFVDESPADGVACKPYPKSQIVGGECGVLFDTSYPTGVHKVSADMIV